MLSRWENPKSDHHRSQIDDNTKIVNAVLIVNITLSNACYSGIISWYI